MPPMPIPISKTSLSFTGLARDQQEIHSFIHYVRAEVPIGSVIPFIVNPLVAKNSSELFPHQAWAYLLAACSQAVLDEFALRAFAQNGEQPRLETLTCGALPGE